METKGLLHVSHLASRRGPTRGYALTKAEKEFGGSIQHCLILKEQHDAWDDCN